MVIKVQNLTKRYGTLTALDNLSLEVKEGEVFGLLGPNGSGKTTAINCILSLLKYEQGSIQVFDKDMSPDAYEIKKDIGVIMQNVAVFNELTTYENIDYFCGLYIKDKFKRKKLVDEAIAFTGLEDFKRFYPKKLSGGLLRRLNIACGIAHKPRLIIMDEPTVAVDPQSRNNILEGIMKLNENGATIVYTSHYMEEVERICSRIVILDKGKIIASGTKEELKAMIKTGEKISVEIDKLKNEELSKIISLPDVVAAEYNNNLLEVKFKSTIEKGNFIRLLDHFKTHNLTIGRIYSELPTLNDVFLELTGKELRD
ncbi:MAG: ABC transporter ATP-binding protein [Clostridiales bacterium]|nr:ABC transporter ATP-binding protein [Clostridiales bacterium]